jgi:hypothetical protein
LYVLPIRAGTDQVTEEERKEHARRIGKSHLQDFEFLSVVEDQELPEDVTEDDMLEIHKYITTGDILID